ncbi:ribosomal-protein-alanine N-acetyltransferase [Proteobacteria bacterium 005FR1]|nr:ribosomal-protein-alanine N-acetyltransferase [Proteobacteria bacterium 005FR1]
MAADGSHLRLRAMTVADVEAVLALERRVQSHPWKPAHFTDSIIAGKLAVVLEPADGEPTDIMAFAVVSIGGGEADLLNIAVAPECQRRGIARALLECLMGEVGKLADTLFLEVRVSNTGAIALYEALDFNQVGVRPNYYPAAKGREDALIYARNLGD